MVGFQTTLWGRIRAAQAGDAEELAAFVERYRAPIRRFIRRSGFTAADCEDLTQEVFLRLCAQDLLARADAAHGRLRSYLLGITRNVMRETRSARARQKRGGGQAALSLADVPEPSTGWDHETEAFDQLWLKHLLERALDALQAEHPRQFETLRLRFVEDLTLQQVADRMRRTPKQVKNDVGRARKRLARIVKREIAAYASSQAEYEEDLGRFLDVTATASV